MEGWGKVKNRADGGDGEEGRIVEIGRKEREMAQFSAFFCTVY